MLCTSIVKQCEDDKNAYHLMRIVHSSYRIFISSFCELSLEIQEDVDVLSSYNLVLSFLEKIKQMGLRG